MSAYAMKPTFTDRAGYLQWRASWKAIHKKLSAEITEAKAKLRATKEPSERAQLQRDLHHLRVMASKLMSLLTEAKLRRDRILAMHAALKEQFDSFPLSLANCRHIDLHFNKGSLEYDFLPMWTLKTQGKSFYIHHIDSSIPWSTRELPEGSTRGMIRLRRGDLHISKDGTATITPAAVELKEVA